MAKIKTKTKSNINIEKKIKDKFKRLGIFVFFDPDGVVDSYVEDLLIKLRPFLLKLVVVSNGKLNYEGENKLNSVCDQLFVRENYGLDAAAYKEAIVSFLGWDEVEKYDEIVLINDTFFGPVTSFQDVFDKMEPKEIDFWGLSAGYMSPDGWGRVKYGYIPDHIQTFFIAFRKKMVRTEAFRSYWYNYNDTMNDFVDVVTQNEMVLTKHFEDLGFKWEICAMTEKYRSRYMTENFNIYYFNSCEMMKDLDFPILKRKVLEISMPDYLYMKDIEDPADAIRYIQTQTHYDMNLIWENVLRRYNIKDIYNSLHLNYIFDSAKTNENSFIKNAAIVFSISNTLYADKMCEHARQLADSIVVYLLIEDDILEQKIRTKVCNVKNIIIMEKTNQMTAMGGLVLTGTELAEKYDFLGFLADCVNPNHCQTTVLDSKVYAVLQNIANDIFYIRKIIQCFSENKRLGLLGVPSLIHHHNFRLYGNEWDGWYEETKKLEKKLKLNSRIDSIKPPLTTMEAFWCRTKALKPIWEYNWTADMFYCNPVSKQCAVNEVLKRILPYVAQSEGYYSGIVMHENYASMRLVTQQYMLDQIVGITRANLGCNAEFYAGYIQQLQGLSTNSSSQENSQTVVTASMPIGVKGALGIYFNKHLPGWLSKKLIRLLRLGPLPI